MKFIAAPNRFPQARVMGAFKNVSFEVFDQPQFDGKFSDVIVVGDDAATYCQRNPNKKTGEPVDGRLDKPYRLLQGRASRQKRQSNWTETRTTRRIALRAGLQDAGATDDARVSQFDVIKLKRIIIMSVETKLRELGLELPPAPRPAGNYLPYVLSGGLLFISGQVPIENGKLRYTGRVGAELTEAEGYAAARLTGLNVLAQIRAALGGFDRLDKILRVEGHVNSAPGWWNQPKVLDGASDLFAAVLGEKAGHARAAFGPGQLPLNVTVELVVTVAVRG